VKAGGKQSEFWNRVLKRIFGLKRDKLIDGLQRIA
jgi:hypothetical protein